MDNTELITIHSNNEEITFKGILETSNYKYVNINTTMHKLGKKNWKKLLKPEMPIQLRICEDFNKVHDFNKPVEFNNRLYNMRLILSPFIKNDIKLELIRI